jgi:hypothetical protein
LNVEYLQISFILPSYVLHEEPPPQRSTMCFGRGQAEAAALLPCPAATDSIQTLVLNT